MAAQDNSSGPPTIYWSKPLTSTLIDLYRKNPCLWNVKQKYYKNRDKRITAVKAIAAEMRKHGTSVTTDDIKKKIDTLRNQYRRECKRVKNSQKSGAGSDDIYVPKLWCFYDLIFLRDRESPRHSSSNLDTSQNTGNGEGTSSGETSDYEVHPEKKPELTAALAGNSKRGRSMGRPSMKRQLPIEESFRHKFSKDKPRQMCTSNVWANPVAVPGFLGVADLVQEIQGYGD